MQTIYDWVTVAIFAGLIVIFLQRSVGDFRAAGLDPQLSSARSRLRGVELVRQSGR